MRKGFTLIELLIVITIMAILAGAAVPYVQDYVEDARIAKCREDLGELRNAIMRYEVERNKLFDPAAEGLATDTWQQLLIGPFLTQALTDPWGRPYYFSNFASMVFSAAEDGDKNTNIISVDCRPAFAPTRAWWYDVDRNGSMTEGDYIDVKFTRPVGAPFDVDNIAVGATTTTSVEKLSATDATLENFATNGNIHPKGANWIRLNVVGTHMDALMAGSLVLATEAYDASKGAEDGATTFALYSAHQYYSDPEALFENGKLPSTASQAVNVPVTIKAAQ